MFLYEKKKKKKNKSTASIKFSSSKKFILLACIISLLHYSLRRQNWRLPKQSEMDRWVKLLWCSQNGCFHAMPERKHRCIWPFLIFLLQDSMLHWTRHSSAAGLKDWLKRGLRLWLQRSKDQGSGSQANYLQTTNRYLFSIQTHCRAVNITLAHPN